MMDNHSHTEAPQMAAPNTQIVADSLCSAGLWKRRSWHLAGEFEGKSSSKDLCDGFFLYYLIHPYFDNLRFYL
jgi:hypothetical protein